MKLSLFFDIFFSVEEDEENDVEFGSASKKRRSIKTVKVKRSAFNKCAHLQALFLRLNIFGKINVIDIRVFLLLTSFLDRVSTSVNNILQKMCTILGLLKDLLLIERLSDSCILQLVKTSFTTFLVDNIQLLQLKAIGLISGVQIYTMLSSP